MRISIKWTFSAVLIVILVVVVYAWFTISDTQQSVERETGRITQIQYEALDHLGAQTTYYTSLPASSLMFDNAISDLTSLLNPVVENKNGQSSYYAVFATIIDANARVWVATVNSEYTQLELGDKPFFDRSKEKQTIESVDENWFKKNIADRRMPVTADGLQKVVTKSGEETDLMIRQYMQKIEGNGELQGFLIVGYSLEGLKQEIDSVRAQGEVRQEEAIQRSIWLALIAVIVGIVIAGIQAVLVTRNIKKLSKVTYMIAGGDLQVRSDIKSSDEIGQLGEQFNVMADRVQELMAETEQKAMLQKEVDIARDIQATLMPPQGYAQCGPVQLTGFFQPASECGGDFWSYHQLADGSVLLTIGDVTGHGVPSAMITACAKSALDTLLNISGGAIELTQLMSSLNASIYQAAKRTLFMTFQAIRISPDGRFAEIVNAGHNFPLLIHNREVRSQVVRGERLGDQEFVRYEKIQINLSRGDMFFLFTDGLTEYANENGVEYGEKRLRRIIGQCGDSDVNEAMSFLWNDFVNFCGSAPQNDDITLMFVKV